MSFSLQWVPRRAVAESGPRPIHLIRHEAYQENQSALVGGQGHSGPRLPPPLEFTQHGFRGKVFVSLLAVGGGESPQPPDIYLLR